jgi:hypothetical protein
VRRVPRVDHSSRNGSAIVAPRWLRHHRPPVAQSDGEEVGATRDAHAAIIRQGGERIADVRGKGIAGA